MLVVGLTGMILLRSLITRTDAYSAFLTGAERGMRTAVGLLPALCGMILMVKCLSASGLMEILLRLLHPLTASLTLPEEIMPMLLLKPLTGSGSMAAMQEIIRTCGVDSRAGRLASALMCSSETIFYTMSVYAGAAGVRRLPGVIAASLAGYAASAAVCLLLIR